MNDGTIGRLVVHAALIIMIIVLFSFILFGISPSATPSEKDDLCREQYMQIHEYIGGIDYCIDKYNDAHQVIIRCTGRFSNKQCNLMFINMGGRQ